MLDIHDREQVERVRKRLAIDPYHLRRLRHALLQERAADERAWGRLPAARSASGSPRCL